MYLCLDRDGWVKNVFLNYPNVCGTRVTWGLNEGCFHRGRMSSGVSLWGRVPR